MRQFLIDNAKFFLDEYHVDGFRYDQVTVIDQQNAGTGWPFCQHLTRPWCARILPLSTSPSTGDPSHTSCGPQEGGAGFHANWHDGLRDAVRGVIAQAAGGRRRSRLAAVVEPASRPRLSRRWRAVQYVESHDEVYRDRGLRIPKLAVGGTNRRDLVRD